MSVTVRPRMQLALALLIILAVYFLSINHPFSRFDDPGILQVYGLNSTLSWLDIITPGGGFYYRPLVNLSYWLDSLLWGMDPTFMHLENIIVHLVNVLLVFLIASRLPVSNNIKIFPFLCALLFGLHPINSESVNWIPGRTDLFAGMFVFFAVFCLIRAIQEQSSRFAILAFGAALVGALTKETAIMFLPAALFVIAFWPSAPSNEIQGKMWRVRFLLLPTVLSLCLVFSLCIFVYIKGHGDNAIALAFEGGVHTFVKPFEAFGFYVKKIFIPLPLNVAIVKVDPLYMLVGFVTLCLLGITFRRAGIPGIFLSAAVLFILPALVVAMTSFAWTPYGERYLYIPSAFVVIACLEILFRFLVQRNRTRWFVPLVSIIIILASVVTFQRGRLWGDNLALLEDIVSKSPDFGVARNEYGVLLKQAGRFDEAETQFKLALQKNNKENVNRIIRLNLIWMKIRNKQPEDVRNILLSEIGSKSEADIELLKLLSRYDEYFLGKAVSMKKRRKIVGDIIANNDVLFKKTQEPHYLYRSGQLALSIGNKQKAEGYFRKAYEHARPDAYFREPARKLAEDLSAE